MSTHRRPVRCSIVPPYLLRALAAGTAGFVEDRVEQTLRFDDQIRARREAALRTSTRASEGPGATGGASSAEPDRTVIDATKGRGTVARREGDEPADDVSVNRAYDGLGETFVFYRDVHGRNSLDNRGLPLVAQVHVGRDWDNAQWDGEQMLFGDGDGEIFGDFTASLDVIAHELTHGVTQYESQFVYESQSGALNESMSDVFGSMVKQYAAKESVAEADWLIGEELLLPGVKGVALRSMKAPGTAYDDARLGGKDPQPAHMRDYVKTSQDGGGVHLNSGIPNRAFYLASVALGDTSWAGAGPVWYAALTDRSVPEDATFAQFAAATVRAAEPLGTGDGVRDAWAQVGVQA